MLSWKLLLTTLIFLSYFDCNTVKNGISVKTGPQNVKTADAGSQSAVEEIPNDLLITLERTECYGTCPTYKLTVKADGSVLFEGVKNAKTQGKAEGKISADEVKQLVKEFKNADYFNLNGKYDRENCFYMTDQSSAMTSIQADGEKKSVDHYQGCGGDDPELKKEVAKLTELENKIDEIVGTKRWIGEGK